MSASPFETIRSKAIAWCRDFDDYKEECRVFAERLRIEFITYLGAKSTEVEFHKLDERLERLASEGTTLSPRLQVGDDGFIYFGITLFIREGGDCLEEHARVGVQRVQGKWRIRWNQLESASITDKIPPAFFDKISAAILDKFSTPFYKIRGQLGFIPTISNDHLVLVPTADPIAAVDERGGQAGNTA
ncbi:hypothetical protein C6568_03775 [Melaminivora suipulveris]|uniref:Uncharacterized protein n=1 Tax=Melaminivora suipulveris TaxID=2109913 RepID=A0A2R3Q9L7_9BURK|nr:hypothetical protein [Melaminivora suipulveris]AVO48476.1 hypothetical protein C6568_03775 [Melaminivora suipulveris]